jgi:hypothetical protein
MGEAGLAQAGGAVKEDMVDGFTAAPGGSDGDFKVFLGVVLADEIGQGTRPEGAIEGRVLLAGFAGYDAGYFSPPRCMYHYFTTRGGVFSL